MSSISSYSSNLPTTTIDYAGTNRYRVMNRDDKDGDGVVDGKSLSGDQGKVLNESQLNQILAARGLKAVDGNFQSVDGFQLSSSNTSAVTSFGTDPVIPSTGGRSAPVHTMQDKVSYFEMTKGLDDAALMWMALSTLATTSMRDIKDATDIKRAMQKGKIEAKSNEISATESRIAAEKEAATQAFVWSVASAAASFLVANYGGSVGQATGQAVGAAVSKFGEMQSKNSGPQAEADKQQIREKVAQMQQEVLEMAIEDAKSNYDEAKESFKNALKAITDHVDREVQVTQAITRS